ncbi:MAG TPA: hypothetical protein PKC43_00090 [Phycisphaerales bacterium]|nr:hypothetical protein [Phycisphaerales bacterium]HMP35823.1 hypothetical protein [Phycisphaerales bacterium]
MASGGASGGVIEANGLKALSSPHRGAPSLAFISLAAALLATSGAPGGEIVVNEPFGRLRAGGMVAPPGTRAMDLITVRDVDDLWITRLDPYGLPPEATDQPVIEVAPAVVERGPNGFRVVGTSTIDGSTVERVFSVRGMVWASLLLEAQLVDVELDGAGQARLSVALFPDPLSSVTALGNVRLDYTFIDIFEEGVATVSLAPALVVQDGLEYDLAALGGRRALRGDGDCPFIVVTEWAAIPPSQLLPILARTGAVPVRIRGLAETGDARAPFALITETVDQRALDFETIQALTSPDPCLWQPDPPERRPGQECRWEMTPAPGCAAPSSPPTPGVDNCSENGEFVVPAGVPGMQHTTSWNAVLGAYPMAVTGSSIVQLKSTPGAPPFATPWIECPPQSNGCDFQVMRFGDCECPCEDPVYVSGAVRFTLQSTLSDLGAAELSAMMSVKFPPQPAAIATAHQLHHNIAVTPALQVPIVGGFTQTMLLGRGTSSTPAGAATSAMVPGCSFWVRTQTYAAIKAAAATLPSVPSSLVTAVIRDPKMEITVYAPMSAPCDPGQPMAVPLVP